MSYNLTKSREPAFDFNLLHIFQKNNKGFLFDGNTNDYFEIPYQKLNEIQNAINAKEPFILDVIVKQTELKKKVIESNEGYQTYINRLKSVKDKEVNNLIINTKPMEVYKYYINMTNSCNLACSYCWNSQGSYGKDDWNGTYITKGTINKIKGVIASTRSDNIVIEIFGGEPLKSLSKAKELILSLLDIRNCTIYIATNSVSIDEKFASFLSEHSNIEIKTSIDGDQEAHDKNRIYPNGKGSFERTMESIELLKKYNVPIHIKATLPPRNYDYSKPAKFLLEKGLHQFEVSKCSDILFDGGYPQNPKEICELDLEIEKFKDGYLSYLNLLLDYYYKNNHLPRPLRSALHDSLYFSTPNACGAGVHIISFDTNGDMSPCMGLIGDKTTKMGEVSTFDPLEYSKSELHGNFSENKPNECESCWLKNKCSNGGCFVDNLYQTGEWSRPSSESCRFQYAMIETKIYFVSLLSEHQREDFFSLTYLNKA